MDEFEKRAMELFFEHRKASASLLQRELDITYRVAAQVMVSLETKGLLTKADQNGRRKLVGPVPATPADQVEEPTPSAESDPEGEAPEVPIELTGDDEPENELRPEIPYHLMRGRRGRQSDWRPVATDVALDATRTVFSVMERGIIRYSSAIAQIDSVGDPRMHLLFACLATGLFAFGQFFGGVCIIAYGLIVFAAGGARK
jgi:hypothetical protein